MLIVRNINKFLYFRENLEKMVKQDLRDLQDHVEMLEKMVHLVFKDHKVLSVMRENEGLLVHQALLVFKYVNRNYTKK